MDLKKIYLFRPCRGEVELKGLYSKSGGWESRRDKTQPAMIEMVRVSKAYEDNPNALFDITLKVEKGEFTYLLGSNGAGRPPCSSCSMRGAAHDGRDWVNGFEVTA